MSQWVRVTNRTGASGAGGIISAGNLSYAIGYLEDDSTSVETFFSVVTTGHSSSAAQRVLADMVVDALNAAGENPYA